MARSGSLILILLFRSTLQSTTSHAQTPAAAESLRDMGRPVTAGAVALSLAGTRGAGGGDAMDAAFNPAALGPAWDAVVSLGGNRYARDELHTRQTDFWLDEFSRSLFGTGSIDTRVLVVDRPKPIGAAAAAVRTPRVGVGFYVDATSRLDHVNRFDRSWRTSRSSTRVMPTGGELRVAAERSWERGGVTWWLRGGATREAAPTLEPLPRDGNPFVPVESDRTWIHGGWGIRIGRIVTDVGFAKWKEQYRVLVDLRLVAGAARRTTFGSSNP